jgi:hypothetical protein
MGVLLRQIWWAACERSNWLAIVLGFEGVITVAAIGTGGHSRLAVGMSLAPLLACARLNVRMTALVTVSGLALCSITRLVTHVGAPDTQQYPLLMVVVTGLFAMLVAMIRGHRENRLIRIAEVVQRAILRPLPAELGGFAFASQYHSATPETLVGGDLYDLTMTQFGPRLVVGDVKGKGIEAVGRCAAVIGAFREFAFAEPDLVALAEKMDARLQNDLGIEDFVTAIVAEFDEGEVRLVNCGHPPPVKVSAIDAVEHRGSLEVIAASQAVPPLGLQPKPVRQDVPLKPGERLFFYTDGFVESRDRAGRFLGLDDRLAGALANAELDGCIKTVERLLLEHTGHELDDDVLLVLCEPR